MTESEFLKDLEILESWVSVEFDNLREDLWRRERLIIGGIHNIAYKVQMEQDKMTTDLLKEREGKKFKQHQVVLAFEVAETADEGPFAGNRMTISKFYTLSLSEKANLRKDLEGWRGKSFTESELEGF